MSCHRLILLGLALERIEAKDPDRVVIFPAARVRENPSPRDSKLLVVGASRDARRQRKCRSARRPKILVRCLKQMGQVEETNCRQHYRN
jgi:hypothetical protein